MQEKTRKGSDGPHQQPVAMEFSSSDGSASREPRGTVDATSTHDKYMRQHGPQEGNPFCESHKYKERASMISRLTSDQHRANSQSYHNVVG